MHKKHEKNVAKMKNEKKVYRAGLQSRSEMKWTSMLYVNVILSREKNKEQDLLCRFQPFFGYRYLTNSFRVRIAYFSSSFLYSFFTIIILSMHTRGREK